MTALDLPAGVAIAGVIKPGFDKVLTRDALSFLAELHRRFDARRVELLAARVVRQKKLDAGEKPDFLAETAKIRESDWIVAPLPKDILDRRVELTGPVDRKMIINALNCGANVYMADFEDASTPTWTNMVEGQFNLIDAVRRTIDFVDPTTSRAYKLNDKTAVLFVRPRGWHLLEQHLLVDGKPMSGSLFDFGLYFFHNAKELLARGSGPYFYLPKMESRLEARLWNDVFTHAEATLGVPHGSVRGTMLIETILATFEAEEMLYELREHASGLNCGRWDYIFSRIKKLPQLGMFPDRAQVTMTSPFMRAYCLHVIKICHRRGAFAMGGMAAQIPIKNNPAANEAAMAKVLADKEREATDGHDGTWVAHPGLVPIALQAFDKHMPQPNQVSKQRPDVNVTAAELLAAPPGNITEAGVRLNLSVGVQYLEAWLGGLGCVPLYNLMEDAATAEISRAQLWQWHRFGASLADGRKIDSALYDKFMAEELTKIQGELGPDRYARGNFPKATEMFMRMVKADKFDEFLTLPAYEALA